MASIGPMDISERCCRWLPLGPLIFLTDPANILGGPIAFATSAADRPAWAQ